jgi:carbon-monoxide dehydrogenase small subunit
MSDTRRLRLKVNGAFVERTVPVRQTLADFLRDDLALTGTHLGCEHGVCGACTVLLGGDAIRSCLLLAVQVDGQEVTTIEGLSSSERLSALQEAFHREHALQCGFCTAGMLITATAFLRDAGGQDEAGVREAISGNLCRCTGYSGIVQAILDVARQHAPSATAAD